jgi:hypothetical protein
MSCIAINQGFNDVAKSRKTEVDVLCLVKSDSSGMSFTLTLTSSQIDKIKFACFNFLFV